MEALTTPERSVIARSKSFHELGFCWKKAYKFMPYKSSKAFSPVAEHHLDEAFRAIGEATEEAVLRSLEQASPVNGRDGFRPSTWKEMMTEHPYPFS